MLQGLEDQLADSEARYPLGSGGVKVQFEATVAALRTIAGLYIDRAGSIKSSGGGRVPVSEWCLLAVC